MLSYVALGDDVVPFVAPHHLLFQLGAMAEVAQHDLVRLFRLALGREPGAAVEEVFERTCTNMLR